MKQSQIEQYRELAKANTGHKSAAIILECLFEIERLVDALDTQALEIAKLKDRIAKKKPKQGFLFAPSLEDCKEYARHIGLKTEEGEQFYNYQETRGWKVKGGLPIVDYKAALRTWKDMRSQFSNGSIDNDKGGPKLYRSVAEQQELRRAAR